jgi:SnoaL-like polyketide cyclase
LSTAGLDDYLSAWLVHPKAGAEDGEEELLQLLSLMSLDVRYEDVPTSSVFHGHQGIQDVCEAAHAWSEDVSMRVTSRQTDGDHFAIEVIASGTNTGAMGSSPATGRLFSYPMASVGRFGPDGLVLEHRDYWDLMSFLRQLVMLPA